MQTMWAVWTSNKEIRLERLPTVFPRTRSKSRLQEVYVESDEPWFS